jgi:microsomal dipeptidase-like Zn-dependent dipeptidase
MPLPLNIGRTKTRTLMLTVAESGLRRLDQPDGQMRGERAVDMQPHASSRYPIGDAVDLANLTAARSASAVRETGKARHSRSKANVDDIVRHIAGLIGVDHVALGPDWIDYLADLFPDLLKPMGIEPSAVKWAEGAGDLLDIQNVAEGMARHGYSDTDIAKVMGQNALRVYRDILGRHGRPERDRAGSR